MLIMNAVIITPAAVYGQWRRRSRPRRSGARVMVATLAQAASAAYYLESQRSFRHPNEYYTAGEEPDGVWFNPTGLFGLADGGKVDSGDFHRLYHGFAPDSGGKLTQNAGSERRSAGLDMTFSADKSISALWAIADPELRSQIEQAHNDAARVALEETVLRHCAYTRIRNRSGGIEVLPADISAAMFQHGTSRDNDPQLHTHCVIFNAVRTHADGKYRALHQHPVYSWMKAAGAVYRNTLTWSLRERLGIRMEQYGKDGEFTRIAGIPENLTEHWSKRRAAIIEAARDMGFTVQGNAPRAAAANKVTRAGKSPDNDPEIRHRRWRGEAEGYVEREALIASLLSKTEEITQEQIRALTAVLEDLPERLTREEAVFRLPDIVERVGNATAGLLGRDAVATSIERVLLSPEIVRLTRPPRSAEGRADMAHTRLYSTRHNLQMEQEVRDMAAGMAADAGHSLPAQAIGAKVAGLLKAGYPLSEEQIAAIRWVTSSGGRVAIIEGAAGSGKTTTLRPIADLYREHGREHHRHRRGLAHGSGARQRRRRPAVLRRQAAAPCRAGRHRDRWQHHHHRRRGGDAVDPPSTSHSPAVPAPRGEDCIRRRHATATAGGSGAGTAVDPRRRGQRTGGPHTASDSGPRGYPDPYPGGDTGDGAAPCGFDGRGEAHPHSLVLQHHERKACIHAVAGRCFRGDARRRCGFSHCCVSPAWAVPYRV